MIFVSFSSFALAAGDAPIACKDGVVIDLDVNPVVSLDAGDQTAFLSRGPGAADAVDIIALQSPGFASSGWTFSAAAYLEATGAKRDSLEKGGYLRLVHGTDLESEFELSTECLLTYDAAPVVAMVAQAAQAGDNKTQVMAGVMVCDPEGSREHAIKAATPAADIRIPIGQAAQGDAVMTIRVSGAADFAGLGAQTVTIKNGKFVAADVGTAGLFCAAKSFDELCVKAEAVFAKSNGAAFDIDSEVDWSETVLARCTVSR